MVYVYKSKGFCKEGAGGNFAGVVLERPDLSSEQKLSLAKMLGYSETVFLTRSEVADYKLEYITPEGEVPLCGHATIAAFGTLFELGKLTKEQYTIETKAGILQIQVCTDGLIFMQQNVPEYFDVLSESELKESFGNHVVCEDLPIQIVSTGLKDILVQVKDCKALSELSVNQKALSKLSKEKDVIGAHAFAIVDEGGVTAICRNFAPLYGIDEESATGTSNCALACYLSKYYNKKAEYVFEQGYNLGEVSKIIVRLTYEADEVSAVYVGGYGKCVWEGELEDE